MPAVASSPEASPRLRRELVVRYSMIRITALAVIVLVIAGLVGAVPAAAYWRASGTGSTTASVATLLPPTNVSVPASAGSSVAVSWTSSSGTIVPTGYYVTRLTGTTAVAACNTGPSALIASTSCTDTSVPEGTHRYVVTAVYRSWTAASAASGSVTVSSVNVLAFTLQPPAGVTAGAATISASVKAQTLWGMPVAGVPVTISIANNPGGGALSGTLTATTNLSGNATFSGMSITKAGTGYSLAASSPGFSGAVSSSFAVTPAAANRLVLTSGSTLTGPASSAALLGPVTLQRQDVYGNPATAGTTTLALSTSAPTGLFAATSNGAKTSSVTIPAESSSASFFYGDTKTGTATITVGSPGLTAPPAVTATITAAAPGKLTFDALPAVVLKNTPITPPVTVRILDSFGNQTDSTAQVTLQSNCTIKGTPARAAASGTATFPDLEIAGKASGCTLSASSGTLVPDTSNAFNAD